MSRTRAYTRKMRAKAIKRKKRIVSNWRWWGDYPFYPHDGMYSKGKIHCSCPLCKSKAYYGKHLFTRQEVLAVLRMHEGDEEYLNSWSEDDLE